MRRWLPVGLLAVAVLATTLLVDDHEVNRPTVASGAGAGYRGAFAYLRARDRDVVAWDRPWSELEPGGTLILALPALRPVTDAEIPLLARWIRDGGHFVYLPSGAETLPSPGPLLEFLRVAEVLGDENPPLPWTEWRDWHTDRARLVGPDGALILADRARTTLCPVGAEGLYQTTDGRDAVCTLRVGRGAISLVNNATVWSNDQLAEGANLALLERLTDHPGPVRFDEWHQGAHPTEAEQDLGLAPLALLAHGTLLYLGFAWTLSRPVGPPLRALGGPASSMLRELDVLGQLHTAGGHARSAAERLRALAVGRFRRRRVDAPIPDPPVADDAAFVALARQIGTLEKEGRDGLSR